jgi:hypothetical protein
MPDPSSSCANYRHISHEIINAPTSKVTNLYETSCPTIPRNSN